MSRDQPRPPGGAIRRVNFSFCVDTHAEDQKRSQQGDMSGPAAQQQQQVRVKGAIVRENEHGYAILSFVHLQSAGEQEEPFVLGGNAEVRKTLACLRASTSRPA